jgi:hypothetical protein
MKYGVIGNGKWGKVITRLLSSISERVLILDSEKRLLGEDDIQYKVRLKKLLQSSGINDVDVVWISIPAKDHKVVIESVLSYKKHIVVEKPWLLSSDEIYYLSDLARASGKRIGVHYQYCYLNKLPLISRVVRDLKDVSFQGEFCISRFNRLKVPAINNLGVHLLAIKNVHFPYSHIKKIHSKYKTEDLRNVSISHPDYFSKINFLKNDEPLIERFIFDFENSIIKNKSFSLDLMVMLKINKDIVDLRKIKEK